MDLGNGVRAAGPAVQHDALLIITSGGGVHDTDVSIEEDVGGTPFPSPTLVTIVMRIGGWINKIVKIIISKGIVGSKEPDAVLLGVGDIVPFDQVVAPGRHDPPIAGGIGNGQAPNDI